MTATTRTPETARIGRYAARGSTGGGVVVSVGDVEVDVVVVVSDGVTHFDDSICQIDTFFMRFHSESGSSYDSQ